MPRRKSTSSLTTFQVVLAVVALLVVCIVLGLLWAPEKPLPPPVSKMEYAEPPKHTQGGGRAKVEGAPEVQPVNRATQQRVEEKERGQGRFSVTGVVVDAHSKQAVPRAGVRVERVLTPDEAQELDDLNKSIRESRDLDTFHEKQALYRQASHADVDEQGRFTVHADREGVYRVTVVANGYLNTTVDAPPVSDSEPKVEVTVALSTGAVISGRVSEEGSGKGAENVRVNVQPANPEEFQKENENWVYSNTQTEAEGKYSAGGLVPGKYQVIVQLEGTPYQMGRDLPLKEVTITKADQEVTNINFTLTPAGIVWGYVMTPDKKAVPNTEVLLCTSESVVSQAFSAFLKKAPPLHGSSRTDGYYEIAGIPLNQEWRLHAMNNHYTPQLADPFLLTPGKRSMRVDIFLFAGSRIIGRVNDSEGKPVQGADVLCIPAFSALTSPLDRPQAFKDAHTQEDGSFVLEQIPAGDYQVFSRKDGYKLCMVGEPVYPDGYHDVKGIQLTLMPIDSGDHRIFGKVTDSSGTAIPGVKLRLEGLGSETFSPIEREAATGSDGSFNIEGVELGMYRMTAYAEGYGGKDVGKVLLDRDNPITLDAAVAIRGRVLVRETKSPPERYSIRAVRLNESGQAYAGLDMFGADDTGSLSASDGSFELFVPAGSWRLEARAAGYTDGRRDVSADAGRTLDGVEVYVSQSGGRIAGRVRTRDGKSAAGATVRAIDLSMGDSVGAEFLPDELTGADRQQTATVGADGSFSFDRLPPGEYRVAARHPGYSPAQSETLTLRDNGNLTNVEITLGSGGILEGYVYRDGGVAGGAIVMASGNNSVASATTNSEGFYTIDGLSAGNYQVMVTEIAGADISQMLGSRGAQVEIIEGRTTRYDFGASGGARIEGQCQPPPPSLMGGVAVLRVPGPPPAAAGATVPVTQLSGQSASISAQGQFVIEDVPKGDWQVDVYYLDFGGGASVIGARYMQSAPVTSQGQGTIPLEVRVRF